MQFQQGFVHAAEFLGAEVLVVHLPQDVALHGEGQMPDGLQHPVVGELAPVQVGHGPVREEHRPQRGQTKARLALVEQLEDDLDALPEIAVPGPAPPLCQAPDARERVVVLVNGEWRVASGGVFPTHCSPFATPRISTRCSLLAIRH
ncbi:MAG: hypothetical protein KJ749_14945 [Planctomycetes bacterium]|nr:hypothetical protein [Planctomycetota bacterium]